MTGAGGDVNVRMADADDAAVIARIYNEGIDARTATFETTHRTEADILRWFCGRHPVVVVTADGEVVAFAATSEYRSRDCYAGVAEFSVYVTPSYQRRGAGVLAMTELIAAAERRGFWKLLSRVFVDNEASRALLQKCGFREVGFYERHGRLDGQWRDVVIVERLLQAAQAGRR